LGHESVPAVPYKLKYARTLIKTGAFKKAGNLYFVDSCLTFMDFENILLSIAENGTVLTAALRQALVWHLKVCPGCKRLFTIIHSRVIDCYKNYQAGRLPAESCSDLIIQARILAELEMSQSCGINIIE